MEDRPANQGRAGRHIAQSAGYPAFMPAPLPPAPPVRMTGALQTRLSEAALALGRLDGSIQTLPNADLFVLMYIRWLGDVPAHGTCGRRPDSVKIRWEISFTRCFYKPQLLRTLKERRADILALELRMADNLPREELYDCGAARTEAEMERKRHASI